MTLLPMLAVPSTATGNRRAVSYDDLMRTGEWVADVKMDGIRAFARWDGKRITFTNRNGVDVTGKFPELQTDLGPEPLWLDGEIVALDGSFETTLTRDKQESAASIQRMSVSHPCRFVAFDIPEYHTWTWVDRRAALEDIVGDRLVRTIISEDPGFLAVTRDLGLEGVILKRKGSKYEFGTRSRSWVKFKNLHRVSCLIAGYTTGTGHRSHFGAMHLALVDGEGQVVPVGRVGTGFSEREIADLKIRLDRQEVLVAEIECLNRTSGNTLRFPVYKGLRKDVGPLDCTTAQLDTVPVC